MPHQLRAPIPSPTTSPHRIHPAASPPPTASAVIIVAARGQGAASDLEAGCPRRGQSWQGLLPLLPHSAPSAAASTRDLKAANLDAVQGFAAVQGTPTVPPSKESKDPSQHRRRRRQGLGVPLLAPRRHGCTTRLAVQAAARSSRGSNDRPLLS
uniref:Uncharacterized protein n=1 Tax=Setaria viridis TaxID=4556 RepID=A0A4U6TEV2_SETVI|nr:hypothetical protein SEVIR_8G130900v2 [Setaria viridis]